MTRKKQTPSQTVGPFFAFAMTPGQYGYAFRDLAGTTIDDPESRARPIAIVGTVYDGADQPVGDAVVEIWQADTLGRYGQPKGSPASNTGFQGFARAGTGAEPGCEFRFRTIKPGSVDGVQAPHINVVLFMRGLLCHLYTRIYFGDEPAANVGDPVLARIAEARRESLIASPSGTTSDGLALYRFDIHMQGERETVFFDV